MQAQKISAWLAIVLSIIGAPLKVVRILRQAEPIPSMAYDYIALVLLVVGAVLVLRGRSGRWLAAGWGFGCAMFYGSLNSHYWTMTHNPVDPHFEHTMVTSTSIFLVVNVIGLALALMEPKAAQAAV
jgi:drug/metabolite transporter (DMT)-like permease